MSRTNIIQPSRVVWIIDSTALLQPHWNELRTQYIEPILTYSDKYANNEKYGKMPFHEFALIFVRTHDQLSDQVMECTPWTLVTSDIRTALDAVQFYGGGFGPIAIGAALQQLTYLQELPSQLSQAQQVISSAAAAGQPPYLPCYCILVSASPADHRMVYVPGVINPAPIRPTLAFHHNISGLFKLLPVQRNINFALLVVMLPGYGGVDTPGWTTHGSGQLLQALYGSETQRASTTALSSHNYGMVSAGTCCAHVAHSALDAIHRPHVRLKVCCIICCMLFCMPFATHSPLLQQCITVCLHTPQ